VVLYPSTVNRDTAGGRSTTSDATVKPFSCHRNAGKLFLKIDASYYRALKVSEILAPYTFVAKVFPEENCDWPQKSEVTLEVSLLHQPEPVGPYGPRVEQLVQNNRVFGKYVLKLSAIKLPPDFKVDLRDCKVQSFDQKTFPMFCESLTNSPPNSCEAILRLQNNSHITVSFELRLTSTVPVHNAFDAAVSLSARLLNSAKSTGDILLKTQVRRSLLSRFSDLPLLLVSRRPVSMPTRLLPLERGSKLCSMQISFKILGLRSRLDINLI
jgi:hypothetical protein